MIYLTYYYDRDVFSGAEFQKWIKDLFGDNVKFVKSEGKRFPSIKIPYLVFTENKDRIKTKNLVEITGLFTIIEQLSWGVRDFSNKLV
jgi:hypothetical protein